MTNHGDDCYFFYYSTCTKGDDCPFRHCDAAMGNETVCNLWQEGRCFRNVCKFRHMEITKKRKEIPCYWEKHPAGCQKPHCAFFHEKPRYVVGVVIPPDISHSEIEEQPHEEPPPLPATPLPTAANLQLRGVMKTESQEPVPSPTHPPVVINPADDDEDEDDQFSEEGDGVPSPRKRPKSDELHNFGVSTLEEIRLRRALKASMNRTIPPLQSAVNGEKENIQAFRATFNTSNDAKLLFEEGFRRRGNIADRLGKQIPSTCGEVVPLKNSLAERLGRFVNEEEAQIPSPKTMRSIKERLTLPSGPIAVSQTADEGSAESKSTTQQIRIKTLEEIRLEKASKSQRQNNCPPVNAEGIKTKTVPTQSSKAVKRVITVDNSKNVCDTLHPKKRKADQQHLKQTAGGDRVSEVAEPISAATKTWEVRVKTLEELRREKAAQIQDHRVKSSNLEEEKKLTLLPKNKLASQSEDTTDNSVEVNKTTLRAAAETLSKKDVKVKTFEEIMREKHLRKQEMAKLVSSCQQANAACETEPAPKPLVCPLKRKIVTKVSHSPPHMSTLEADNVPPIQNVRVEKLKTVKSRKNTAARSVPARQSTTPLQEDPHSPSHSSSNNKQENTSGLPIPDRLRSSGPDKTRNTNTKVRPKLNVKPSVMQPLLHVQAGKKRKAAERSAVAAVKPLNSASILLDQPPQQPVSSNSSEEVELSSPMSCILSTLLESSCSSSEDQQNIPAAKDSLAATTRTPPAHSSVPKAAPQSKSRRQSVAASRNSTSAVDEFEDLINEFTDDHLEGDMDPGIGEDDLLQELSDMIDS
ncbi:zinc finger CCCH domain-containing protein 11A isoform X1 [Nerophis lumbriciformis]|uniref:zinc finger CCCH domain-containing protein 11A isoform X1 n=1 Tax=Nerophis lumbriciformis TaxID=546530 RepID=UPI002ADF49E2|nr:zinc finger CCCH domain-containing protein 11A-like isoform X1 [Nerophis lumbriciformis]XP_061788818.1 zinc finger CCCH domain-containing protein 11A-like isoform X1 [Nerophis lumbriciformis]XP_061788819.1 zinc finger CCCH domain-containing protein 11A-like isoform X1 [Nerophis lumbriciformis]XP_061788820.1 zinc finger CCCH domain-containing protein 11A-like isoform X1 [Nerophis lumbriciformis]XP_061788821.1 zinc finger CCCH domain-containing protein 11A-like isoform X1 [Nerophis lumbricifor